MSGPSYDPVPWSTDHVEDVPYGNPPPSPGARLSSFQTPETEPLDLGDDFPPGAARPRFIGAALAREGPNPRESYASSSNSFPIADDYTSSVYALNAGQQSPRDPGFYNLNYRDDPNAQDMNASEATVGMNKAFSGSTPYLQEKRSVYSAPARSRRRAWIIGGVIVALLVLVGVALGVYFAVIKPNASKNDNTSGSINNPSSSSTSAQPSATGKSGQPTVNVVTGGDGSKVTTDGGSTFTYSNKFGGTWYWNPQDPFNNGAQAQSWTPRLNETFHYGTDPIRGVNLGGWLNTEPFITPALYEKYLNATTPAVDEWTLSQNMAADTANGGLQQLENHYKTFITEEDFAQIAGAGLNFVRIPLPYWAIEVRDNEPFLARTCWTYFLKAIQWARKYGIRINLDLHALPGSQNGWNHSGRLGTINVLNGPMGLANAQRSLDYIRILAEFISQPQYKDVVVMFGVTNEPQGPTFGQENLIRYYLESYKLVRTAGGVGEGNGPFISFHEGFAGLSNWVGTFTNSDRTSLDIHPYLCFSTQSASGYDAFANTPCTAWASNQNNSMNTFGLTTAGEFSNAINDCGLYVNGVGLGTRYEGTFAGSGARIGSCDQWTNYAAWDATMKSQIMTFALASMDALQNWFFWTWKIGNSSVTGDVEAPAWSYQLGLQQGWMPLDPRQAIGVCGSSAPFNGALLAWQTGGAGADQIPASFSSAYAWPPTALSNAGAATLLPTYTQTGPVPTLPGPTFSATASASVNVGSGWENSADTAGLYVAISGCSYLDPWVGPTAAPPSPLCSAAAKRNSSPPPSITAPPSPVRR